MSGKVARWFHIRIRFLRWLLRLLAVGLVCWVVYTQIGTRVLLPIARRQITQLSGTIVDIESIDFTATGAVRINQMLIGCVDDNRLEAILDARTVEARFSIISILMLQPRINHVTIRDFVLNAQYETETGKWNLGLLDLAGSSEGDGKIPFIDAQNGILRVVTKVADGLVKPLVIVGVNGSFAMAGGIDKAYGFYLEVDHRLGFGGSFLRGILKPGPGGKVTLNDGAILMGPSPVFDNTWSVRDISLDMDYDERNIRLNALRCRVGDDSKIAVSGKIEDYFLDGQYDVRFLLENWTVTKQKRPDVLVYSDQLLDKFGENLKRIFGRYNPEGLGDIDLRFMGRVSEFAKGEIVGTITGKDVSISYENFPYLLEHISGTLDLTERNIVFNDLSCTHGEVDLSIDGYSRDFGPDLDYDIRISSPNMKIDDDLYRALNTAQKKLWFTFAPSGTAKTDLRLTGSPTKDHNAVLTAELIDAKAVYQHFPYPMDNVTGKVIMQPGRIDFENVVSRYDGDDRTITLNGEVTDTGSVRPRFNILIDARNIPIDSILKDALPARQKQFYDHFAVNAQTDVEIKVFPNEVGRRLVEYIAHVTIRDASLLYNKFPLPLTEVYVDATLTPDLVELKNLTGRNGEGTVQLAGTIWPESDGSELPALCLSVEAKRLELDKKWLDALPEKAAGTVTKLRPTGLVNISANLDINAGSELCSGNKVVVECLQTDLNFEGFPYPIEDVTGTITITPDKIVMEDLKVHDLALGPELGRALPDAIGKIYRSAAPTGHMDLNFERAVLFADSAGQKQMDFFGEMVFKNCTIGTAATLSELDGVLSARALYKTSAGLVRAEGDIKAEHLKVKDRVMTNFCTDITYDPNRAVFETQRLSANFCGGSLTGSMQLDHTSAGSIEYILRLAFDGVDVKEIVSEKLIGQKGQKGLANGSAGGTVSVKGLLGSKDSGVGRLNVNVREMTLAKRSLLGKILTALQMNEPTDFIFSDMAIDAYIRKNKLIFERVYMSGENTVLLGSGQLDLKSNKVRLDFNAAGGEITHDPSFLESLAKGLGSAVIKVEVRGDIDDPQIDTTALPVLSTPFGIFGSNP